MATRAVGGPVPNGDDIVVRLRADLCDYVVRADQARRLALLIELNRDPEED